MFNDLRYKKSSKYCLGQRQKAVKIYPHPEFRNVGDGFDIALVQVNKPFWFNGMVSPICLPPVNWEPGLKYLLSIKEIISRTKFYLFDRWLGLANGNARGRRHRNKTERWSSSTQKVRRFETCPCSPHWAGWMQMCSQFKASQSKRDKDFGKPALFRAW